MAHQSVEIVSNSFSNDSNLIIYQFHYSVTFVFHWWHELVARVVWSKYFQSIHDLKGPVIFQDAYTLIIPGYRNAMYISRYLILDVAFTLPNDEQVWLNITAKQNALRMRTATHVLRFPKRKKTKRT